MEVCTFFNLFSSFACFDGVDGSDIDTVVEHTNVSRELAIEALKKNNMDRVNAIMARTFFYFSGIWDLN